MKNRTTATALPVILNRLQLAAEIGVPTDAIYRASRNGLLTPDALDSGQRPFWFATPARLLAIKQSLEKPEVLS